MRRGSHWSCEFRRSGFIFSDGRWKIFGECAGRWFFLATGQSDDVDDFGEQMTQLVGLETDFFLDAQCVNQPVEDELGQSQPAAAGDDPDEAGVNGGVGTQDIDPKEWDGVVLVGGGQVPVFGPRHEVGLP